MKVCIWLWFLLLSITSQLPAQPFTSRTLSLQQGLPEYYVSGLVQDKAGFIWVATRNGLARYDGRQFKVYQHQPFTTHTLAGNLILSLESVSDTTLLLRFEDDRFQLFNPLTERFTDLITPKQLESSPRVILTGGEDQLWGRLAHQLVGFNRKTKQFQSHPFPESAQSDNYYSKKSILLHTQGHLFAATRGLLLELDPRTGQYQDWANPAVGQDESNNPGFETYYDTHLLQRSNGEILISAFQQLLLFNPKTHRFRSIRIPGQIRTQTGLIYQAGDGNVYFTYGMSVYRLAPDDGLSAIWTAPRIDYQNYFHALLVDRSGVLWIGTNGDGIQQIDLRALPIKTYAYTTNFVHDVLSAELGLSPPAWTQTYAYIYPLRLAGPAPYLTVALADSYQLLRGERNRRTLQAIVKLPFTNPGSRRDDGNGLRVLPDGTLWLYDPHRGLLHVSSTGQLLDSFPCAVNHVNTIYPQGDRVWLGSETDGLLAYDTNKRRIVHHLRYQATDTSSLISNHVLCMAPDPANPALLWLGTQEGLSRLDTRTLRFQNWTARQGLPSPTIQTLLTDRRGNLWFSTLKGISRLDPRTGQLRHFSITDGLLDIEYRQNHALELADGRLAFGGNMGMTVFDPLALQEIVQPIPIVLTGLKIANVAVEPRAKGSPLTHPLNTTQTLRLGPTQNFLSLEFAGLQYNKPASLQYRYQLTGVDADWVYSGNQSVANYTHLDPGTYQFRVNAANAQGNWSPLIKTIQIIIDPPWWQTGWAYVVYGLVGLVLVRAYIQYRIHQAQLQQEMALQEQEARLIKENADWQTRFFTNITHEFRTPLTLIINPLEKLLATPVLPPRTGLLQQLGLMHRNAGRLLRLINQLLDMAKLEAGQLGVITSRGNLADFVGELVDTFRPRAERKGVQLMFAATAVPTDSLFDAHKLETIGYNLLDNALKFTPAGGHIRVQLQPVVSSAPPFFQLQVIDSGMGIPPEQLSRIFDRYYQGRQAEGNAGTGTGIGLFLIAEFARLLGGQVQVASQEGQGTTFTVTLPVQPSSDTVPHSEPLSALARVDSAGTGPQVEAVVPFVPESADAPLVVVVDDNEELREFIAGELAGNYRVLTAPNGQEGWQVCLSELPELVISDVMMPLLDGFTLVERIKTTPLTAHIAVILLTAKTMTEARIQGLTAGANDYLTKPFHGRELHLRIANLLRHQQQLRQHWQQRMSQPVAATIPVSGPVADDPFLNKFYALLERELANVSFGVEDLADELAVSQRTLHRKLSTLTGKNAIELMRVYRLQQAARFLQAGCSVSEAGEKAGFVGVSYFSKAFKAQFGVSPSGYLNAQDRS